MEPCAAASQQEAVTEVVASAPLTARSAAPLAPHQHTRLRALEDDIHRRALVCLDDVSRWTDVDPKQEEPPAAWVDELGLEGAQRRLRVARAAWMSPKEAPVGIKVAQTVAVGISRARATEGGGAQTLNVQTVVFVAPRYEVVELPDE